MPRFEVSPAGSDGFQYFIIVDSTNHRIIAQSFDRLDADFIGVQLNDEDAQDSTNLRIAMATKVWGFRLQLERENGGPLIEDPQIGLVLDDFCRYLHLREGERALVLGRDLLVYLHSLDNPEVLETSDLIII